MSTQIGAHAPAHLRLLSFVAAGTLCGALTYFAFTGKFTVISEFIDDAVSIDMQVEQHEEPPPPPPQQIKINPPPVQHVEPDLTQPPTFTETMFEPVQPPPVEPVILTGARFIERPSGRDFARYYPDRALQRSQQGRVLLRCTVGGTGAMACNVASETPQGWGFGDASLRAAQHFRVAAMTADGRPTSGGVLEVPMVWRAE